MTSPVFLEGEKGHISKQAGECDLATNDAFENALFDRNEAIPTTRNDVRERFREGGQPAGLAEKAEKEIVGNSNVGNGNMAKIPNQVLLAPNQVLPLVEGSNNRPNIISIVINN